jgi:hypothetical protein
VELRKLFLAAAVEIFPDEKIGLAVRVTVNVFRERRPLAVRFAVGFLFLRLKRRQAQPIADMVTAPKRIVAGKRIDHEAFRRARVDQDAKRSIASSVAWPWRANLVAAGLAAEQLGNSFDRRQAHRALPKTGRTMLWSSNVSLFCAALPSVVVIAGQGQPCRVGPALLPSRTVNAAAMPTVEIMASESAPVWRMSIRLSGLTPSASSTLALASSGS